MPFDIPAPVIRHDPLNRDHFLLTLECGPIAREARAGQFVMLQARSGHDPLLRRPMSICRVLPGRGGRIEILYKVVGEGTRCLSTTPIGAVVPTLGPLGNGFALPDAPRRALLVSGGIGIAIFPFIVEALRASRRLVTPLLVYGARSKRDLVFLDFFRKARVPMRLATEDGSAGTKGYVTGILEPILLKEDVARLEILACGPTPMLKAVGDLALRAGVACQLALESQMPCGVGVCLGCVVRCPADERGPIFRRVCTEGPIFPAGGVVL